MKEERKYGVEGETRTRNDDGTMNVKRWYKGDGTWETPLTAFFENPALWKVIKREFDRSFKITVERENGKITVLVADADSGSEFMTVADLAIILQTTRQKVRALTQARAQTSSRHPVPFFKINGKSLRFKRSSIMEWLGAMNAEKPVFAPAKGKGRK